MSLNLNILWNVNGIDSWIMYEWIKIVCINLDKADKRPHKAEAAGGRRANFKAREIIRVPQ